MKKRSPFLRTLLAGTILLALSGSAPVRVTAQGDKTKLSDAEVKAAKAVEAAPDANAKLAAGEDFIKNFPNSQARQNVADHIATQIGSVKDQNQKLALVKRFQTVFTSETEAKSIKPVLVEAYIGLNQLDEAFSNGSSFLSKYPDEVLVLADLAIAGTEQATKHQNTKYIAQSGQYGTKAIALLEADTKPADASDEEWKAYKSMLPQLYQEMAIISLMKQDAGGAQSKLEKAQKLNPSDPFNYVLLGSIANQEYQRVAQNHKNMPDGKAKDDMLKQATGLMDKVIDFYAHAVALSEGKPDYQKVHDQVLQDLSGYYKYRHNNSTDGLQKLIDGYKLP